MALVVRPILREHEAPTDAARACCAAGLRSIMEAVRRLPRLK
jgi:hypothetical protein